MRSHKLGLGENSCGRCRQAQKYSCVWQTHNSTQSPTPRCETLDEPATLQEHCRNDSRKALQGLRLRWCTELFNTQGRINKPTATATTPTTTTATNKRAAVCACRTPTHASQPASHCHTAHAKQVTQTIDNCSSQGYSALGSRSRSGLGQ